MKLKYLLAASVVSLSSAAILPAPVMAQQITSGIEGSVVDANGSAVSGATVVITDTRTGQTRTLQVDANGSFRTASLVPGGPYTITATADGFEGQSVEGQFITVSGNTDFTFELAATADASDNVIIVSASRANVQQLAVGPGSAFSQETLEGFPSLSRDVRDIIRLDPRVSLERENEVDRISCLGGNDRSNTFTVDGIVQADVFGLNGTPFAARNALPLPFDVIRETSVEFAPFDVEYSDFTGCLVNVVTKSGTNEFHGSAFYTFRNEDLRGDSIDGADFTSAAFEEKRWGATLGGPIINDRLFFYAGYEETDLGDANDFGPQGAGFVNEADYVDIDQFNQFAGIAQSVYGQDVGGYPAALPESSVRYFGRIDALISDDHRLEATYQRLKETNVEADFGSDNLTGLNSFEDEGTASEYYSVRLYSDWSNKVSTELRVSRAEVSDVQGPVGFGEAQAESPTVRLVVGVTNQDEDGNDVNGVLSTGPGIFRSANALESRVEQAKFQTRAITFSRSARNTTICKFITCSPSMRPGRCTSPTLLTSKQGSYQAVQPSSRPPIRSSRVQPMVRISTPRQAGTSTRQRPLSAVRSTHSTHRMNGKLLRSWRSPLGFGFSSMMVTLRWPTRSLPLATASPIRTVSANWTQLYCRASRLLMNWVMKASSAIPS
jgi:hypothetical protein